MSTRAQAAHKWNRTGAAVYPAVLVGSREFIKRLAFACNHEHAELMAAKAIDEGAENLVESLQKDGWTEIAP